jgi:hypothetical protein
VVVYELSADAKQGAVRGLGMSGQLWDTKLPAMYTSRALEASLRAALKPSLFIERYREHVPPPSRLRVRWILIQCWWNDHVVAAAKVLRYGIWGGYRRSSMKLREFIERLAKLEKLQRASALEVVIPIGRPGSVGGTPCVGIKTFGKGLDWDSGKFQLWPEVTLTDAL